MNFENLNLEEIKKELLLADFAKKIQKDILIVVHNQYEYVKNCIESIYKNTKNFNLYIWNNASDETTSNYLNKVSKKNKNVKLYFSNENVGFIIPNNRMIKDAKSPYIILLNSDTEVRKLWDKVLIGFLEKNKKYSITGFLGGILNSEGRGTSCDHGENIDYICGYCMCFNRKIYEEFGLFDEENLKFAYHEDADFCLRVQENNKKIYACYSKDLVFHYTNITSKNVLKQNDFTHFIKNNKIYMQKRWAKLLSTKSI